MVTYFLFHLVADLLKLVNLILLVLSLFFEDLNFFLHVEGDFKRVVEHLAFRSLIGVLDVISLSGDFLKKAFKTNLITLRHHLLHEHLRCERFTEEACFTHIILIVL